MQPGGTGDGHQIAFLVIPTTKKGDTIRVKNTVQRILAAKKTGILCQPRAPSVSSARAGIYAFTVVPPAKEKIVHNELKIPEPPLRWQQSHLLASGSRRNSETGLLAICDCSQQQRV